MPDELFPEGSPFQDMQIASHDPLRQLDKRPVCEGCKKKTKYFCYRCIRLAPDLDPNMVPTVSLPLHLAIVKDTRELEGKSTVIHAKLLAENDTTFYNFDRKADENGGLEAAGFDPTGSVILFPSSDAKAVPEIDWSQVRQLVVLDGTWQQAKAMCGCSPLLNSLPKVRLSTENKTFFWRYQSLGPHCLSTIEAIYYFYREHQLATNAAEAAGGLDNLLFFYSFFYHLIQDSYKKDTGRRFHTKKGPDYIKYDDKT